MMHPRASAAESANQFIMPGACVQADKPKPIQEEANFVQMRLEMW
jgi:hypothetical protein